MATNTTISNLRNKIMTPRKILSTGNPDNPNELASGLRAVLPDTDFISRTSGFNLDMSVHDNRIQFQEKIKEYNTFINLSYIKQGNQLELLNCVQEQWKFGEVINIGSVSDQLDTPYGLDKKQLKETSLHANTYRLRTSYVSLGSVSPRAVGDIVKWLLDSEFVIPIIGYEEEKQPW